MQNVKNDQKKQTPKIDRLKIQSLSENKVDGFTNIDSLKSAPSKKRAESVDNKNSNTLVDHCKFITTYEDARQYSLALKKSLGERREELSFMLMHRSNLMVESQRIFDASNANLPLKQFLQLSKEFLNFQKLLDDETERIWSLSSSLDSQEKRLIKIELTIDLMCKAQLYAEKLMRLR